MEITVRIFDEPKAECGFPPLGGQEGGFGERSEHGNTIEDSDLVEDAIQLFFSRRGYSVPFHDKCGERAISIESGIEKLQWAIIELADRLERQGN